MDFTELDSFITRFLSLGVPGCDCIILKSGKVVFRKQYGLSDPAKMIPVNGTERYHIYSCSKPITCVTALQLWEKGLFKLDDQLADYMPEFKEMLVKTPDGIVPAKNAITIRHLFSMTAGFNYNTAAPSLLKAYDETGGACPTRETMKYLAQEPLDFEPGTNWRYSLCHDVLAAFTEVISGMTFEKLVEKNIFAPLGMKNSTFLLPAAETSTVAPLFYNSGRGIIPRPVHGMLQNNYRLGAKYASGGAGAVSTVDDYSKFLEAWRTDALIKTETRRMMTTEQVTEAMYPSMWFNNNYTYGLGVRVPKPGMAVDYGWGGAAGAFLAIEPEAEISLFYAQHVLGTPNADMRYDLFNLALNCMKK